MEGGDEEKRPRRDRTGALGSHVILFRLIRSRSRRRLSSRTGSCLHLIPPFRPLLIQLVAMPFGEVVCGSPGSGKSTYCYGKHQLFTALNRPISIVNLDPANENIPYPCAIDVASLIKLEDVMNEFGLGPNGGMLYCMEYLEANYDWLEDRLKELDKDDYILFDLPGQVELSTNHSSVKNIIRRLTKSGFRVCRCADLS